MYPNDFPIIPCGRLDTGHPTGAEFHDEGDVLYIHRDQKGTTRGVSSSGIFTDVGTGFPFPSRLVNDQSGRVIGYGNFIGAILADGSHVGSVPSGSITYGVAK